MFKKKMMIALALLVSLAVVPLAVAQDSQPTGQKTLSATMNVHVFPGAGQDSSQQSTDEAECYNWAVKNTGTDPFDLAKQAEQQQQQAAQAQAEVDQAGKGAGAKGAVAGAAGGAAVGKIVSDDAGKGAAYGAAAGGIAARRKTKRAKGDASQQIDQQAQQAQASNAQQLDNFKKSYSVCLEAKDYMVKF